MTTAASIHEKGGGRAKRPLRRLLVWCVVVVSAWYSLVLLLLPDLSCGPSPAGPLVAWSRLRSHAIGACMAFEAFGDANSLSLRWLSRGWADYTLLIPTGGDGTPSAVVALPCTQSKYTYPLVERLIFLKWEKYKCATFLLLPDGRLFRNSASGYTTANPPPFGALRLDETAGWQRASEPNTECVIGPPPSFPTPDRSQE